MTNAESIERIVIVGGGTAGWMVAAALAKAAQHVCSIELVESDSIATIGVGEATIPPLLLLHRFLNIDEADFVRQTGASFKLGIEFQDWGQLGDRYMHAFGPVGLDMGLAQFHHYWLRDRADGNADNASFWDYSLNACAAKANRFVPQVRIDKTPISGMHYAYHFDAALYVRYLQKYAQSLGVIKTEATVKKVTQRDDGFIDTLCLDNGKEISADFFVDCSGFQGLLIAKQLKVPFEDWSKFLPCDRAIALPSEPMNPLPPYTQSIAHDCGWRWRIPLQHRTGNGLVYASRHLSADKAEDYLRKAIPEKLVGDARHINFNSGRRSECWHKNCVAIGLSSGFVEPLESTSIHLIQTAVMRLMHLFPNKQFSQANIDEYNRKTKFELEHIRDFIVLHYHLNERKDSEFWKECATQAIPKSLEHRINLFKDCGRVYRNVDELFTETAWLQIMLGQGIVPNSYHPLADGLPKAKFHQMMAAVPSTIAQAVEKIMPHQEFIDKNCAAPIKDNTDDKDAAHH